jgi:transglutaminase-like putative cysteine protease
MILDASCRIEYHNFQEVPAIFMLRPRSGWAQWVMREQFHIHPQVPVIEFTDVYGNSCQRIVMPPGDFQIDVQFRVEVQDQVEMDLHAPIMPIQDLPTDLLHYLLPSRYCQSDVLASLANSIIGQPSFTYNDIAKIHDWIHRSIAYTPGSSDTSTSAVDTARDLQGVCRDYAHLGIALCRALDVPARMVVGFLHELQPMDLHAWFEAYIGNRWHAFDSMQSVTQGNRIVVAYGRDAADVALATLFGPFQLNFMEVTVNPASLNLRSWS